MKKILLILFITLAGNLLYAQNINFAWAKQMVGTGRGGAGQSVTTDAAGNVYNTGSLDGTIDFDRSWYIQPYLRSSAFTPNNDGKNDLFKILGAYNVNDYHLLVYNRQGQKAFETIAYNQGWDGRVRGQLQNAGVFVGIVNSTSKLTQLK